MKMCIKCRDSIALPESDFCEGCNPSGISATQKQVGNGPQQQAQSMNTSGISIAQHQTQKTRGSQQQSISTEEVGKSSKEVMTELLKIDQRLENIQEDVGLIKEYTSQIENIFDKLETLEDLEEFLRVRLSSDFEKIKKHWQEYKMGKISKHELIIQSIKIIGKKFVKAVLSSRFS